MKTVHLLAPSPSEQSY